MQREITVTGDGSHTIVVPGMNVTYHSHHGAIAESTWVFVDAGFSYLRKQSPYNPLTILEIGFGTGLNALLTLKEAIAQQQPVHYTTIETHPLTQEEIVRINHGNLVKMNDAFLKIHRSDWEKDIVIDPFFTLHKKNISLLDLSLNNSVDCIYFDAFAPTDQPELWTQQVFEKLYKLLTPGGILVTYSSKSIIRKAMQAAGFNVTKIPGPHGKRDMVRAFK
jgi:tRNA U34 5-methylaminomethyl-2-thiouridine-forming methyltransferase MnmC